MKKVVLFSPCGYVGSAIKERLLKESEIQLYEITRNSNLSQYPMDCDILIYSAAVTSARHANSGKYVQDNVVTAFSMMNFCQHHHVRRIIYLSSDEIYGELNMDIVSDRTVMVNPNTYAVTKYLAEKIIMESEIPYFILRLPGIVGQVWRENFICSLMEKIKSNVPVELYNLDKEFNNILDIDDLVQFIVVLCDQWDSGNSEILLLGNTEYVKLADVVFYMKKLYQSTSVIHCVDSDNKRYFTLDVAKAMAYGYHSKKWMTIIDDLYRVHEEKER